KHADERLVIRGRSLRVRARQVEQVEVGDDARAPQRERATKEFAATVIQARTVLHLNAPLETAASPPAGTARSSRGSAYRSQRRRSRRCRCWSASGPTWFWMSCLPMKGPTLGCMKTLCRAKARSSLMD